MKLIARDTDYAIRALCFISKRKNAIVSVNELVETLKAPRAFLRKTLQTLNKAGLLKSYKGRGGGFRLGLRPGKIFLVDLLKIFQGEIELNECLFKKGICPNIKKCVLRKKILKIETYVISQLASINLLSLIKG